MLYHMWKMSERKDKYEAFRISPLIRDRLELQAKTFTKWINSFLKKAEPGLQVLDIFTDLRDGQILIKLIQIITGEQLPKPSNGLMRIHLIENVNKALGFLHCQRFHLESIGAEDIVDGNPTLTLGLIWSLICRFQIDDIEVEVNGKTLNKSYAKGALLLWCQHKTFMYSDAQIRDFTKSWSSGMAFNVLIDAQTRHLIDLKALKAQTNIQRLNNAFIVAEQHFGIPKLLDAEDVDTEQPDENSILTYISLFYHKFERNNKQLKEQPNNRLTPELRQISPFPTAEHIIPQSFPTIPKCFVKNFQVISELGTGGFGTVFRAEDKTSKVLFAVKKVIFSESSELDRIMREVNHLSKCSGDYVVQYFDSWIEDNNCLYIQMELCSDNLKNIIQQKPKCFERNSLEVMSCVEYFISGQLFKELVECVQYMHELEPPIIHRDLKPHNILIVSKQRNGRYLKICDFGLATEHQLLSQTMSHTRNLGTIRYMAPEVYHGIDQKSRYSTKVDIFSLGVIGQELFDFDVNSSDSRTAKDGVLREKWINFQKLTSNMMNPRYGMRPDCRQILKYWSDLCSISFIEIKDSISYEKCINQMKNFSNNFFCDYFKEKLMF